MNSKANKNKILQKKSTQIVDENTFHKLVWISLAIVCITTFAIYYKAIKFDLLFTWDDNLYISENKHIMDLHWENIKLFFTNFYVSNYQPITMLFYALEYKIGAGQASIFHFNNILLHILNTYLVFVLIKRISPKNPVVALITAAFFAVHPMHVESVAWVAERKDVLYAFFFLLSLIMYTYYLTLQKIKYLILASVFFLLSCLSKSAAVILPLVLLLFDYYSNRKFSWKMIVEKIPLFVISLIFGIVAINSQKNSIQDMTPNMSFIKHVSIALYSFMSYLIKAFIPINLSAIYPYQLPVISYQLSVFCWLGVWVLGFVVWYSRRWGKDVIFGFIFFILTIILVLQFVRVGAAVMADRYTYIPYIGVFFIIGKLFEYLISRENGVGSRMRRCSILSSLYSLLLIFVFFTFATISYGRVKLWKNDDTLFSDVINKYPECNISYRNRGSYYLNYYAEIVYVNNSIEKEMYIKKSIIDFENSLKFSLTIKKKVFVYYNLGTAKAALNYHTEALKDFNKAVELDPEYPKVYVNRGNTRVALHDFKGALSDFDIALNNMPDNPLVLCDRSKAKDALGDYYGAIRDLDKAIKIDPNFTDAYNNRGIVKHDLKDFAGAIGDYNKVIELNPNIAGAYCNRGFAKINIGDKGACDDFRKAAELGYTPALKIIEENCK